MKKDKPKEPMSQVTLRMPKRIMDALENASEASYRSLNQHIIYLLDTAISEPKSAPRRQEPRE